MVPASGITAVRRTTPCPYDAHGPASQAPPLQPRVRARCFPLALGASFPFPAWGVAGAMSNTTSLEATPLGDDDFSWALEPLVRHRMLRRPSTRRTPSGVAQP